ncbi:hypothetical protein [Ferrovibrio sp.]|uniref:hypothetical protein n=1 Tax=Ferrovibrio sp. TaxID=1917215 RepID=UPI00311FA03B
MIKITMVALGNSIVKMDTIEYDGKHWLVPEWLHNPATGISKPARMILLDVLPHQKSTGGEWDFVLHDQLPRALIFGPSPSGSTPPYVVVEAPDIGFRIPKKQN